MFTWLKWAFFGNDDDGLTGPADFMLGHPEWQRRLFWWLRNPAHNFTFYVIGFADKTSSIVHYGKYPMDVFAPNNGLNYAARRVSGLYLPFVSYQSSAGKFYLGWRERGNLGFKATGAFGVCIVFAVLYTCFSDVYIF